AECEAARGPAAAEHIGTGAAAVRLVAVPERAPPAATEGVDAGPIAAVSAMRDPEPAVAAQPTTTTPATTTSPTPPAPARRHPLRFVWQLDAAGIFTLGTDEFARAMGPPTMALMGRPWVEIAAALALDPERRVEQALGA